jgi:PAS domain S-box-containing protein
MNNSEPNLEKYFFNLLMDNIPDRIYFKDLDGKYIKLNIAAAKRRGLDSPDGAVGKTDFDFFTDEHALQAYNDEQGIIKNNRILENKEEKQVWFDGKLEWVSTTKAPISNDTGEIIGTFGITRDITTRKLAQDALKESENKLRELNAVKDKFFSIIAHDLRGPFSGLFGLLDMVREDFMEMSNEDIKENLDTLDGLMRNLFQLLEDLLEWGSIQRNTIEFIPVTGNISQVIRNVVDLFAVNARNKNINLSLDIPDSLFLKFDKKMVSTIVRNLLTNAIKFTKPRGEINIIVKDEPEQIKASVQDNGIGISHNNLQRLFNLTEYFTTQGTNNEGGSGLGLILCKEFVEKHSGKISVETELNKGSIFTFTLPKNM